MKLTPQALWEARLREAEASAERLPKMWWGAALIVLVWLLLFGLFWAQFVLGAIVPESLHAAERIGVGIIYLLLGAGVLFRERERIRPLLRDGLRTPYTEMAGDDAPVPTPGS